MTIKNKILKINYLIKTNKPSPIINGSIDGKKIKLSGNKLVVPISEINKLSKNKQHTIDITVG
ncbi:MAG: hypothetical protein DRN08_06230 [Thermoplasmata archaeon]|nr:MAG: hypothetical protein DRN08_06230 [Thermoplasmata archaeon]